MNSRLATACLLARSVSIMSILHGHERKGSVKRFNRCRGRTSSRGKASSMVKDRHWLCISAFVAALCHIYISFNDTFKRLAAFSLNLPERAPIICASKSSEKAELCCQALANSMQDSVHGKFDIKMHAQHDQILHSCTGMSYLEAVRRCFGRLGAKSLRPGAFPASSHSTPVRVSSPGRSGRSPSANRTCSPPFSTTACSCTWSSHTWSPD